MHFIDSLTSSRRALVAFAFVGLALLLPIPAIAQTAADFRASRLAIEAEFTEGGQYSHLNDAQQAEVLDGLRFIEGLLQRHGSIDKMKSRTKLQLFNRQERLNQLLVGMDPDEMVVCDREERTGTRMKTTMCATVAERRARMEDDQRRLNSLQRAAMPSGG